MRKLFLKFSTLLFVLTLGMNAVWAGGSFDPSQLPPEMLETLLTPSYCARLTGHASSTGGGKVYVNAPSAGESSLVDPRDGAYVEGTSNVAVNGMGMSMAGMTKIGINAWAKADPGYWFVGFSYANMGTDLGTTTTEEIPGLYANMYDIGAVENETIDHVIYGTFEPIRISDYEISGTTSTDNKVCNLTVTFSLLGTEINAADFKAPYIASSEGGGLWTSEDGDAWTTSDLNFIDANTVSVNVKYTAPSDDAAEYSAYFVLETQANVSVKVLLRTRTEASQDIEAMLYNGKVRVESDKKTLEGLLGIDYAGKGYTNPIIKLNKNYEGQIIATQSFTLDLNGYNITHGFDDVVADYSTIAGQTDPIRIAQAAVLINKADAVVTLAYSPYGGKIVAGPYNDAIDVLAGKLVLNGGTLIGFFGIGSMGDVVQNGAIIIGGSGCAVASMGGKFTMTDGKIYGELGTMGPTSELVINGGTIDATSQTIEGVTLPSNYPGVQVGGGTALIKKGTIKGGGFGVQNIGGTITIEKLAVITGGTYALDFNDGLTTINCGKFDDPTAMCDLSTIESKIAGGNAALVSCYLKTNNPGASNYWGIPVWRNTSGAEFREGYEFFVGPSEAAKAANVSVCHIGGTSYSSLEDAIDYVNNTSENVVIIMDNDYTLPAGYYTIPSNATLLIPMSNEQGAATAIVSRERNYTTPSLFRKLTLENGVNMDVFGTIEVSGTQYSGDSNQDEGNHTGAVIGNYAQLQMNKGSKITMQNNSVLRAWGYVTGDVAHKDAQHNVPMGEIDVRRGATVYELFQMGDWGNTVMNGLGLVTGDSRFPITSYFIQNVEVPTKYHPGGRLTSVTTVSANNVGMELTMCANDIQIIGVSRVDIAMFLMNQEADAENTWVRKWYDASKDQQVYEINSGAHIGNLVINLASSPLFEGLEGTLAGMGGTFGSIGQLAQHMGAEFHQDLILNSGQYVLPITSNFKLHLLSGTLDFTQSTELIPGSELEIDKEATVYVTDQDIDGVREGSLYIYDWRDWDDSAAEGQPAHKILYTPAFDDGVNNGAVPNTVRSVETKEDLGHAQINVHGTFDTKDGYIFTSGGNEFDPEHGGNIFSSVEDAGTFKFTSPALLNEEGTDSIEEVKLNINGGDLVKFYPAYLKNQNGTYVHTGGTAAGQSYCYIDMGNGGEWTMLEQRGCFTYNAANGGTYYIKPQEYVPVVVTSATQDEYGWIMEGNDDHTFSDAAGAGRLFIKIEDEEGFCQWWEVEQKDNLYHCIHPENDTYYYWDEGEGTWLEKRFTITWLNWDGEEILSYDYTNPNNPRVIDYSVTYGTMAEYLGEAPTRANEIDYTYDFTGWSPALGKVTSDVTYTATYEKKQIKYTVTFMTDGGAEIERHLLARNETPVCENAPTKVGYTLQWEPAIAAVTGNATYVATWLPEPPTEYEISFVDYDGTTVLKRGSVAVGLMPEPPANPNGKKATSEYTYVFDHWTPAVTKVSQAITYTAVYREEPKLYTVTFKNEDNSVIETNQYHYGETPVCSATPTKANTAQYTYSFAWDPQIQTVMGNATYKATFTPTTNKYTVSVKSNPSGACVISGAGTFDYGTSVNNVAVSYDSEAYEFLGWNDLNGVAKTASTHSAFTLTEDVTIIANFRYKGDDKVTITWKNWDGSATLGTSEPKVNAATTYTGATPTKDATAQYTYTFDGWTTAANGGGTFYKNNMTPKATANTTYFAHFSSSVNQYTVTLASNPAGICKLTGAGTYDYNESATAVTVSVSNYNENNYTFTGWSDGQGGTNTTRQMAITGNINLVANFAPRSYAITWKSEDGTSTLETDESQTYGNATTFNGVAPTKENCAFDGWTTEPNGAGAYYTNGSTPTVNGNATYYAHFRVTVIDMEIPVGSTETLTEETTRHDLVIRSDGDNSSQLVGSDYLHLTGSAHFDFVANAVARKWYAFGVPWQVDAQTGISVGGKVMTLGKDFDVIYYDGAERAASGKNKAWKYVELDGDKTLQPGRLYMIAFMGNASTIRFTKKAGAKLLTTTTQVYAYPESTDNDDKDANWNGISNPALFYAFVNAGSDGAKAQRYNSASDTYSVFELDDDKMVVGEAAFVQAPATKSIVVNNGGSYAPRRAKAETNGVEFDVRLAPNGSKYTDRLFVQMEDEKEDVYTIGKDLVKFGIGSKVAQMWINRYDDKLCVNTAASVNGVADFPMSIYSPNAAEYRISATNRGLEGVVLYLTYNGEAVWNLTESDYVAYLSKGTDTNYGLRISAKAPQVTTGVDEALVDAQGNIRKVLINGQVFIIRGDKVYTIDGQMVK